MQDLYEAICIWRTKGIHSHGLFHNSRNYIQINTPWSRAWADPCSTPPHLLMGWCPSPFSKAWLKPLASGTPGSWAGSWRTKRGVESAPLLTPLLLSPAAAEPLLPCVSKGPWEAAARGSWVQLGNVAGTRTFFAAPVLCLPAAPSLVSPTGQEQLLVERACVPPSLSSANYNVWRADLRLPPSPDLLGTVVAAGAMPHLPPPHQIHSWSWVHDSLAGISDRWECAHSVFKLKQQPRD